MRETFSLSNCDVGEKNLDEKIADAFAQELLVPEDVLRRVFDEMGLSLVKEIKPHHIVELTERFRVSFYMMALCLRGIDKISFDKFNELKGFSLNQLREEVESGRLNYSPNVYFTFNKTLKDQLKELALIALRKGLIGFFDAAKILDETEAEIKAAL